MKFLRVDDSQPLGKSPTLMNAYMAVSFDWLVSVIEPKDLYSAVVSADYKIHDPVCCDVIVVHTDDSTQ